MKQTPAKIVSLYFKFAFLKTHLVILSILFVIPAWAYSQTEYKPKYSPRKEKHRNKRDELDRKQGLWKHYNYLGTLIQEVEYLDDKRNGIQRLYYGNGRVMRETEYLYGIKDGSFKRYSYDGLATEGEYVEGKKQNQWTNYYSSGQIKNTGFYLKGYKDGIWKYYNRKGEQINTIVFKGGRDVQEILEAEKKAADAKKATEAKKQAEKKELYRKYK